MSERDELIRDFLVESHENLDRLDGDFIALETCEEAGERLQGIFRTIHTIKGSCGFLDLVRLESVTHAGESLLSALREGLISVDEDVTTALLELVDAVREMLLHLERTGEEKEEDYNELISTLKRLQEGGGSGAETPSGEGATAPPAEGERALSSSETPVQPEEHPSPAASGSRGPQKSEETSSVSSANVRVQVDQLDKLMNLAGELVLARNQILQSAQTSNDATTIATAQRLNLITTELQERIMKVRMQPVGTLWNKLPRVVRDISKSLGKQVELTMKGKGTELDKTLLEAIKDPLTHIIRNAIDHGLEPPEDRVAAGKEPTGKLCLAAYHESGQVFIEIVDDGRGIDVAAVKQKAIANGLVTPEAAAAMNERQALSLIFHAGLSTAKAVTSVSGRGVGMDVVKDNIEGIGGAIELSSVEGKGTSIRIKIPLTLAIIPALIVTTAGDRYVVPQVSLVELVRLDGEDACRMIEDMHGTPVYRLRGNLLPLVFLDEQLRVSAEPTRQEELDPVRNIVVVRAGEQLFGLVVDEINDTEEIVVKPLDQQTKSVETYAGTTILGDGRVALILDVLGISKRAGVTKEEGVERTMDLLQGTESAGEEAKTFLLMEAADGGRMAVDLGDVDRLEELSPAAIQTSGGRDVIHYRGEIMPLVYVSEALGGSKQFFERDDLLRVVVHSRKGERVGLVVSEIVDIVETTDLVRRTSTAKGIKCTIVIDGRVADQLDLDAIVDQEFAGTTNGQSVVEASSGEAKAAPTRQFCTFYLDDLFFGVDVTQVQEVMRHQPMTRVPLTSGVVRGLINLRGQTVTALDMRRRLALEPRPEASPEAEEDDLPMNLVLRTSDGIVSILVDRIGDVLTVRDDCRAPVPNTIRNELHGLLTDVYKLDEALLLPLDIERLVSIEAAG